MQLLLVATVALSATMVAGYSMREFEKGSSQETHACSTLVPLHGPERKPPNSAYQLSASRLADGSVSVKLSGSQPFKGFIIQSSGPAGEFSFGSDAIKVGCSQATIRHKNAIPKTSVSATWKPSGSGTVSFKGTVVEDFKNFYELSAVSA
ncbi:putative defense protein 1 [Pollicipes pollicipes]|uniref:putative defense protein 1 n=1 Tax=Pollicipes pollicipes TaxID=41117 RepID=UPI001884AA52|nr:putative defense protein 1 [Pollicipes pollicipes]